MKISFENDQHKTMADIPEGHAALDEDGDLHVVIERGQSVCFADTGFFVTSCPEDYAVAKYLGKFTVSA